MDGPEEARKDGKKGGREEREGGMTGDERRGNKRWGKGDKTEWQRFKYFRPTVDVSSVPVLGGSESPSTLPPTITTLPCPTTDTTIPSPPLSPVEPPPYH
ncbi:hypothetical protein E2C01_086181 [Portunus trituberculatus]|uniref:Uncharacterized protein n=1 Tax=Portunus trituberculatus TaxID=210409 RepID=A0A5B7J4S1_PORTR|nr:hypothetical protein [Portunus trituberculatus]